MENGNQVATIIIKRKKFAENIYGTANGFASVYYNGMLSRFKLPDDLAQSIVECFEQNKTSMEVEISFTSPQEALRLSMEPIGVENVQ